jgi:hypothetical protein
VNSAFDGAFELGTAGGSQPVRMNGHHQFSNNAGSLDSFAVAGKLPRTASNRHDN